MEDQSSRLIKLQAELLEKDCEIQDLRVRLEQSRLENDSLRNSNSILLANAQRFARLYNAYHNLVNECFQSYVTFSDTVNRVRWHMTGKSRSGKLPEELNAKFNKGLNNVLKVGEYLETEFDKYPMELPIDSKSLERSFISVECEETDE